MQYVNDIFEFTRYLFTVGVSFADLFYFVLTLCAFGVAATVFKYMVKGSY